MSHIVGCRACRHLYGSFLVFNFKRYKSKKHIFIFSLSNQILGNTYIDNVCECIKLYVLFVIVSKHIT